VCDLLDAGRTTQVIRDLCPEVVIHSQALSDVDRCEREPALAQAQNVQATANLVGALATTGAFLVYVSSDYVFDGTKGRPYDEGDAPKPLSVYGRSKVRGEHMTLQYARSIVVRPSTLFGAGRMNFCDQAVRRLREGQPVEAFVDQTTSPTYTDDLAEALDGLIRALVGSGLGGKSRVYHLVNAGSCTRAEFAYRLADLLGRSRGQIRPIRVAEQHRPAPRPRYCALMTKELPNVIGRSLRPWDDALQSYLRQRGWLN
jgi:dTDP-4-dehydrorhamnose reductase